MTKRQICSHCDRPIKTCLCDALVSLKCQYQLIILQDPKEAKHALSSAPILAKSIQDARLVVGEIFDPIELLGPDWKENSLLVFPNNKSLTTKEATQKTFKHLILLDGTWRKVARLIHLNPWLIDLSSIAIQPSNTSEYQIRKSPREDGLSTIEAAVYVLNDLQQDTDFSPILNAFRKMIQYQVSAMGDDIYNQNY